MATSAWERTVIENPEENQETNAKRARKQEKEAPAKWTKLTHNTCRKRPLGEDAESGRNDSHQRKMPTRGSHGGVGGGGAPGLRKPDTRWVEILKWPTARYLNQQYREAREISITQRLAAINR